MADTPPFIVGLGGSMRPGSSTERAVAVALRAAEQMGARTRLFDGRFLCRLPVFGTNGMVRTAEEQEFVEAVGACQGVIVGSPGYHGGLSGVVKNALDLLEDLNAPPRIYLDGCAFGCIVTAAGSQGACTTLVALRSVAHALRAWPTPLGVTLTTSAPLFDADGICLDPKHAEQLAEVARQVVTFAQRMAA